MSLRSWAHSLFSGTTARQSRKTRRSRPGSSATKFRPRGESLEHRLNMAGNVLVSAIGPNLYITGDHLANEILIEPNGAGVDVQGINTSINGLLNGETNGFNVQNIFIEMGNGDDKAEFVLTNLTGLLRFSGGNGNDQLLFGDGNNGQNSFGSLQAIMGDGNDTIDVAQGETSFRVTGAVSVLSGEGANSVNFDAAAVVLGPMTITGGNGTDDLTIGQENETATVTTGYLSVTNGNGENAFAISGKVIVNGGITVLGGKDADNFLLLSTAAGSKVNGSIIATQGEGKNIFTISEQSPRSVVVTGLVSVTGGAKADSIFLSAIDVLAVSLSLGAGDNNAFVDGTVRSSFSINSLGGDDRIFAGLLDVHGGTVINTGGGADLISLVNSHFRSVVAIFTGDGADTVSIESGTDAHERDEATDFDAAVSIDLGAGDDHLKISVDDGDGFIDALYTGFAYLYANGGSGTDTLLDSPFNGYDLPPTFISFP
jgi:hypothetical protein